MLIAVDTNVPLDYARGLEDIVDALAVILAESALLGCRILLSTDDHMREIDFQRLTLLLKDFDVAAPVIATPREIVRKFCR